jgi:hypothetical protein
MTTVSTTNVLALPLAQASIETGTNEDWIDAFEYLTGDTTPQPLDLRGINFQLMIRRDPDDPEVILLAQTADGTIQVGATPDYNFLIINVPVAIMKLKQPGDYIGDMIANDALWTRTVMTIDLTIVDGVTK